MTQKTVEGTGWLRHPSHCLMNIVKPSRYEHPVSARDNVCRGSSPESELIYELAKINMDGPTPEDKKRCNFTELCDKRLANWSAENVDGK